MPRRALDRIAQSATELTLPAGVLVSGRVDLSFGGPWAANAKVTAVQTVSHSGYPLGWSSMVEPYAYRATATA